MSNIKIANLNVKLKNFFYRYIEFTYPFHGLSSQQQKVLALILYHHHKLSQEITNNKILWKEVFDYDTKLLICEELSIKDPALQNLLSQLRKKNVIIDGKIAPVYMPEISVNSNKFTLTFNFNIKHD